jgi:tetratricopeptide (TPR) repeat protein
LIFFFRTPPGFLEGFVARCFGDKVTAESAFNRARAEQEKIVREQPKYAAGIGILGLIDAALGRKEEAIREGKRACEITPLEQDVVDGAELIVNLALIYEWTGQKDQAYGQLATAVRIPSNLSYGLLKLHPQWDELRVDPRFDGLVARLTTEPDLAASVPIKSTSR